MQGPARPLGARGRSELDAAVPFPPRSDGRRGRRYSAEISRRVVRLAALVHLELEVGVSALELREHDVERRRLRAR